MLFNSYIFIFAFLPFTFVVYRYLSRHAAPSAALNWLTLASLFFYGWWNPAYVPLILLSMAVNFWLGNLIHQHYAARRHARKKALLITGVTFNLGLLGYFKYANFFVDTVNALTDAGWQIEDIVLPLAISFFTFQQIAYLVDVSRGDSEKYSFSRYALFVTFFPQLIAGPIVHHREMLPQFLTDKRRYRLEDVAIGLVIFSIGLFKKAVFADGIAAFGTPIFEQAGNGEPISFFFAWGGALCYTFQLYFDFSGYSDMAIGAARMFGIRLPVNFASPYKSLSISDFWRRWHMTLSRFLRDYVYIALGGNAGGEWSRYRNLMATMLLGGLWHGAGWTFVLWGGLHGIYLVVNHYWRHLMDTLNLTRVTDRPIYSILAWITTFLAVVLGWVLFRAESMDVAVRIYRGMLGLDGIGIPNGILVRLGGAGSTLQSLGIEPLAGGGAVMAMMYLWIIGLALVAFLAPNTQQIMAAFKPALQTDSRRSDPIYVPRTLDRLISFRLTTRWAILSGLCACGGVFALTSISEFLYFQF